MSELHDYPYTNYEDDFCGCCRMLYQAGVKLDFANGKLHLLNKGNFVLSEVTIERATTALQDENGHNITAYLINAGASGNQLVFTDGTGNRYYVDVPFARASEYDVNDQKITSYLKNITLVDNNVRVTLGDGSSFDLTIPFATKASTDINNKPLVTYAASLVVSGNKLLLKNGNGETINEVTVSFASSANADGLGNTIASSYGSSLQTGTTTLKLISKDGTLLSEVTCPYSISSSSDTDGNAFLSDYAELLVVDGDGRRIGVEAHDGTRLSTITVPFSTLSTDSTNAVERVEIVGDQIVFTTYGGVVTRCTIPYSLRSLNDGLGNEISETYVADVQQDAVTGEISFYDKEGNVLCSLTPSAREATYDPYGNEIADFIKTLVFDNQSNYLAATHGDGTVDSIVVNYSTMAHKDDLGNIIKNVYLTRLECITDADTGHSVLVGYNGEGSEILRIELTCYMAQRAIGDEDGNNIKSSYVASGDVNASGQIELKAKDNTVLSTITVPSIDEVKEINASTTPYIAGESGVCFHGSKTMELKDTQGNTKNSGNVLQYISTLRYPTVAIVTPGNSHVINASGSYETHKVGDIFTYIGRNNLGIPQIRLKRLSLNENPFLWQFQYDWQAFQMDGGYAAMSNDQSTFKISIPYTSRRTLKLKVGSTVTIPSGGVGTIGLDSGMFAGFLEGFGVKGYLEDAQYSMIHVINTRCYTYSVALDVVNYDSNAITFTADDDIEVSFDWDAYGSNNNGYTYEYDNSFMYMYGGQIQTNVETGYVDFDQITNNTIKASMACYFSTGGMDNSVIALNDAVVNNAKISGVKLNRKSNSNYLDEDISPYDGDYIIYNGNNEVIFSCTFANDIVSIAYNSANDDMNYFQDGDVISISFGYDNEPIAYIVTK